MLPALLMIVLAVGLALFIAYPLLAGFRSIPANDRERETVDLLVRRDQLFHDIRETELDYKTGKLSDADYEANILQLKTEAAEVLARLEGNGARSMGPAQKPGAAQAGAPHDLDVEALVAAASKRQASRAEDPAKRQVACLSCDAANPPEAQFCMKCGAALTPTTKETS